jgi:hypothetical protein
LNADIILLNMSDEGEKVDWVRGPKLADLEKVPVGKIVSAGDRGLIIEPVNSKTQPNLARVSKVVASGMPAPKSPKLK